MKKLSENLFTKILNYNVSEELAYIDSTIISESLECTVLREVAKQLKTQKANKENEYGSWVNNKNFKEIFMSYGSKWIEWDKVTDSNVEFHDADEWKDKGGYLMSLIRKVIQGKENSILISQDKESKKFIHFKNHNNDIVLLTPRGYRDAGDSLSGRSRLNQKEQIEAFKGLNLYFIKIDDSVINNYNAKKNERQEQKKGMIYLDEYHLKRMAEENRERYKKIIAQNRALLSNDDELIDKCGEIIKVVTEFITEVAKDPISNADYIYPLNDLSKYIYDVRKYVPSKSYKQPGYYSGVNGLIPMLTTYLKAKKETATGSTYYDSDLKTSKKEIENTIGKIYQFVSVKKIPITLPPQ